MGKYRRIVADVLRAIVVVAAIASLVSTHLVSVLKVHGSSMSPTLTEGDTVLCWKTAEPEEGDLAAFYVGRKVLIKRCIAGAGRVVDLDEEGNVYVDGSLLDEPYLAGKALGNSDTIFPCTVPEGAIFCLGDERTTSLDSRHSSVGFVSADQIIGKVAFCIWPISHFGGLGG